MEKLPVKIQVRMVPRKKIKGLSREEGYKRAFKFSDNHAFTRYEVLTPYVKEAVMDNSFAPFTAEVQRLQELNRDDNIIIDDYCDYGQTIIGTIIAEWGERGISKYILKDNWAYKK